MDGCPVVTSSVTVLADPFVCADFSGFGRDCSGKHGGHELGWDCAEFDVEGLGDCGRGGTGLGCC